MQSIPLRRTGQPAQAMKTVAQPKSPSGANGRNSPGASHQLQLINAPCLGQTQPGRLHPARLVGPSALQRRLQRSSRSHSTFLSCTRRDLQDKLLHEEPGRLLVGQAEPRCAARTVYAGGPPRRTTQSAGPVSSTPGSAPARRSDCTSCAATPAPVGCPQARPHATAGQGCSPRAQPITCSLVMPSALHSRSTFC